tara:strand:+ start:1768 stop:2226 length:459 start_codon:yes stop_codon:yes gene_type:complete
MKQLSAVPLNLKKCNEYITAFHRHNKKVQGCKFTFGCLYKDKLVGVCVVGRPISRFKDDGFTAEVTRICVFDAAPSGVNSFLYARAWRVWKAMGGKKIITYTLQSESGCSLRGANYKIINEVEINKHKGWLNRDNRKLQAASQQPKFCWMYE